MSAQEAVERIQPAHLERTYLPLIGPSVTLCLRRLEELLSAQEAALVDPSELAVELGLPRGLGRSAPMIRTLNRLIGFRPARWEACRLFVAAAVPLLSGGMLKRLPASAKAYHRLVVCALMVAGGDGTTRPTLAQDRSLVSAVVRLAHRGSVTTGRDDDRSCLAPGRRHGRPPSRRRARTSLRSVPRPAAGLPDVPAPKAH